MIKSLDVEHTVYFLFYDTSLYLFVLIAYFYCVGKYVNMRAQQFKPVYKLRVNLFINLRGIKTTTQLK